MQSIFGTAAIPCFGPFFRRTDNLVAVYVSEVGLPVFGADGGLEQSNRRTERNEMLHTNVGVG